MEFRFVKGLETLPMARDIRKAVFVDEQKFSEELEFDDIDANAWHLLLTDKDKPVGTGRMFPVKEGSLRVYKVGRIAVMPEYRKSGAGRMIMEYLEKEASRMGVRRLLVCAQVQAKGFYNKCGYRRTLHLPVDDEGVPHVYMSKRVKKKTF